jgi:hypothetical protein
MTNMATTNIPERGPLAEPNHHITPTMIDIGDHLWGAFGHGGTEISANYIVRMMQRFGDWRPFSIEDIERVYHEHRPAHECFQFNRLVEPGWAFYILRGRVEEGGGWVVRGEDGLYRVTVDFIERCYKSGQKGRG